MAVKIDLFPRITNDLIEKMEYQAEPFSFGYRENGQFYDLETILIDSYFSESDSLKLSDKRCTWYPETHELHITKKCEFKNVMKMFDEARNVSEYSVIGLAVQWSSKETNQCGVIQFGAFDKTHEKWKFFFDYTFERGSIQGILNLKVVMYMKEPKEGNDRYTIESGTILGELETYKIYIDGSGSLFPIKEVNSPKQPLWWVDYNAIDPMTDMFSEENVCIILNSAHANYEMLKIDTSLKESQLLIEIVSSALQIIVQSVKDSVGNDWNKIISGQGFDSRSIAEIVHFFISKFEWDVSTANSLSLSLRKFFDSRL